MINRIRFPEGGQVILKSGGPVMTIEYLGNMDFINVVWFDVNKICHRDTFHPDALTSPLNVKTQK